MQICTLTQTQPRQHPTTQFLRVRCPSCHPINSVKALFTFAQQAVIVYFYLSSNFQEIAMLTVNVQTDYFLPIILDCTLFASKKSI